MSQTNPSYLIAARDQFKSAQYSLIMAARALQMSGKDFGPTIKEVKETIGDLAITVEQINDHIEEPALCNVSIDERLTII